MTKINSISEDLVALIKINQYLFSTAKKSIKSLICRIKNSTLYKPHQAELILIVYCYKAIDSFEGIIKLQKEGLMEDAQILIRALFETNQNFGSFIKLASETDPDPAATKVMHAIMIMKGKDAEQQDSANKDSYNHVEEIKNSYTKEDIEKIKNTVLLCAQLCNAQKMIANWKNTT